MKFNDVFNSRKSGTIMLLAFFIFTTTMIAVMCYHTFKIVDKKIERQKEMMVQCLEDGKKEYECRAIIYKDNGGIFIMPTL